MEALAVAYVLSSDEESLQLFSGSELSQEEIDDSPRQQVTLDEPGKSSDCYGEELESHHDLGLFSHTQQTSVDVQPQPKERIQPTKEEELMPETSYEEETSRASTPRQLRHGSDQHSDDTRDNVESSSDEEPEASSDLQKTPTRKPYSLSRCNINPETSKFLKKLERFWTKPHSMERRSAPVSSTTFKKSRERMLCEYLQLHYYSLSPVLHIYLK